MEIIVKKTDNLFSLNVQRAKQPLKFTRKEDKRNFGRERRSLPEARVHVDACAYVRVPLCDWFVCSNRARGSSRCLTRRDEVDLSRFVISPRDRASVACFVQTVDVIWAGFRGDYCVVSSWPQVRVFERKKRESLGALLKPQLRMAG